MESPTGVLKSDMLLADDLTAHHKVRNQEQGLDSFARSLGFIQSTTGMLSDTYTHNLSSKAHNIWPQKFWPKSKSINKAKSHFNLNTVVVLYVGLNSE